MEKSSTHDGQRVDVESRLRSDGLAREQVSLARVVLGGADSLSGSDQNDVSSEKAEASCLGGDEVSQFLASWKREPLGCIRSMNQAIGHLDDPTGIRRYIEAAVDLEILMDRALDSGQPSTPSGETTPVYLAHGYTVIVAPNGGRRFTETIGVNKKQLRSRLVESKEQALAVAATEKLLGAYYDAVIDDLERDPGSVEYPAFVTDDERVAIALYLKEGVGLSRRLALRYQLCLQEAGVASVVVEGELKLFGTKIRHAWNLAWFEQQVALVDVTLPGIGCPLILLGESAEDVYRGATRYDRLYTQAADNPYSWAVASPERTGERTDAAGVGEPAAERAH